MRVNNRLTALVLLTIAILAPVYSQVVVTGSLTRAQNAQPGDEYTGTIELKNAGTSVSEVRVFKTDYQFDANGNVYYLEPGQLPRSNASWIQVRPGMLTLQAGQAASLSYNVRIPRDVEPEGTYWSVIMVEIPTSAPTTEGSLVIQHIMRYAVQIVTQFSDSEPCLTIRSARIENKEDAGPMLHLDIMNTGNVWTHPEVSLELFSTAGDRIGPFKAGRKRLYPGSSSRFSIPLKDTPAGFYQAIAVLDSGDDGMFAAQYEVELIQ